MARLHLVRHAEASAGWGAAEDPGLSERGRGQAEEVADRLGPLGPLPILTGPTHRARETAAALERRWHTLAIVEPGVGEVPSPSDVPAERHEWLRQALGSRWTELGPRYVSWRRMVVSLLAGIPHDTVVVTHFVLINVALGHALGRDEVRVANVENASVTVVDNGEPADHEHLTVVEVPAPRTGSPGRVL